MAPALFALVGCAPAASAEGRAIESFNARPLGRLDMAVLRLRVSGREDTAAAAWDNIAGVLDAVMQAGVDTGAESDAVATRHCRLYPEYLRYQEVRTRPGPKAVICLEVTLFGRGGDRRVD